MSTPRPGLTGTWLTTDWQLYVHKRNPSIMYWVKGTREIGKQRNGRYSVVEGEMVDIRSPRNAFGYGSDDPEVIKPPELCTPAGQIPKSALDELYDRADV